MAQGRTPRSRSERAPRRLERIETTATAPAPARGTSPPSSTRERLLSAASALFYRQGIRVSNVDQLAAAAEVSKPTLYALFGSKEGLVRETLERRRLERQRQIDEKLDRLRDPEQRLRAMLELHVGAAPEPDFRGCPLVAAALEVPESSEVRAIAAAFKSFLEERLARDARAAGYREPERLAAGLLLLLEGAIVLAYLRGPAAAALRRAWEAQLGAHRFTARRRAR